MTTPESGWTPKSAFRNLLVPLDGSKLAESVIPVALGFARRLGARVTLLHVLERGAPSTIHGEPHLGDEDAAGRYLSGVGRSLAGEGLPVVLHVHPNLERDVAGSIVGHAVEMASDLVVLATHGTGGLRDFIVGSIAEQVLNRGTIPVLLLRPGSVPGTGPVNVSSLMVPLDGTPDSEQALTTAEVVALAWGADVILLRVVPTRANLSGEQAAVAALLPSATALALELEMDQARGYLQSLAQRLASHGVMGLAEVRRGDPILVVPEAAQRLGVDLVVMATHGRAGLDAFWKGSFGCRLASRLSMPILILRSQ